MLELKDDGQTVEITCQNVTEGRGGFKVRKNNNASKINLK